VANEYTPFYQDLCLLKNGLLVRTFSPTPLYHSPLARLRREFGEFITEKVMENKKKRIAE